MGLSGQRGADEGLPERLEALHRALAEAVRAASRPPGSVRLLPVSKGQPLALVQQGLELGLRDLGENYVQECSGKAQLLGLAPVRWHLLGHLQKNKAARAAKLFHRVLTLDSLVLGRLLSRAREGQSALPVLCEVELTGLPGRGGYRPGDLDRELGELARLPGIKIEGLMTVADPARPRAAFEGLRELRDRLARTGPLPLAELSMGMSQDFRDAIAEGSTEVRVGSLLFGPRPPRSG